MARKNALEEQNAENKRKRVCLQKQAKLVDPKQEETLTKAALKYFNIRCIRFLGPLHFMQTTEYVSLVSI